MAKAEEFAKLLNDKDFVWTTDWIYRRELNHNISCEKVSGEARRVNYETTAECSA
jgi:hypothetical protein